MKAAELQGKYGAQVDVAKLTRLMERDRESCASAQAILAYHGAQN